MKKVLFVLMALFLAIGIGQVAYAQQGQKSGAVITADKAEHDFGPIREANGKVSYTFVVRNTGTAPLLIQRTVPACACTTPQFSTEPIAPGKEGRIVVTFDPTGRPGPFVKTVAVYSNGRDGSLTLRIKGTVE